MLKNRSTPTKLLLIKAQYLSKWPESILLTAMHNLCMFQMAIQKARPHKTGSGAGASHSFPSAGSTLEVKWFNLSGEAHILGRVVELLGHEGRWRTLILR